MSIRFGISLCFYLNKHDIDWDGGRDEVAVAIKRPSEHFRRPLRLAGNPLMVDAQHFCRMAEDFLGQIGIVVEFDPVARH